MAGSGEALAEGIGNRKYRLNLWSYENRMVLVTSLVISFLAFDRLSTGYIGPYLIRAFNLSNTELGALYSIQALTVALAGYFFGKVSDATGWRKRLLVPMLIVSAICSFGSLLVQSYVMLLVVRLAMGGALGGMSPLTQSIVSGQSSPHRVGLNLGVQTLLMFLVSQMLGPVIFTRLADQWGWQAAYLASALPFLLLALAVGWLIRESATAPAVPADAKALAMPPARPLAPKNVWLCIGISSCFMLWLVIHATFLPLYLVEVRGYAPTDAGSILSVLGLAGCVGGLGLPMLSDRIGRRNALALGMSLALIAPLAVLLWTGSSWGLSILLFVGWMSVGSLPIYAVVVPGESVSPDKVVATIALTIGAGEIVGGVIGPLLAGSLADRFGLAAPFWFTAGAALVCLLLTQGIKRPLAI
jgi:MFS family permease